jgi:hypothetical protein
MATLTTELVKLIFYQLMLEGRRRTLNTFSQIATNLQDETIFRLQVKLDNSFLDDRFKLEVSLSGYVQSWEEISNKSHEDWQVVSDNLWNVEVT